MCQDGAEEQRNTVKPEWYFRNQHRLCSFPAMKPTFKNIQEALKFILNFLNDEVIVYPKVIIMPFFYKAPTPVK